MSHRPADVVRLGLQIYHRIIGSPFLVILEEQTLDFCSTIFSESTDPAVDGSDAIVAGIADENTLSIEQLEA